MASGQWGHGASTSGLEHGARLGLGDCGQGGPGWGPRWVGSPSPPHPTHSPTATPRSSPWSRRRRSSFTRSSTLMSTRRSPTTTSSPSRMSRSPASAAPRTAGGPSTRPGAWGCQLPPAPERGPLAPGPDPTSHPHFRCCPSTQQPCQGLAPPTLPPGPTAAPAPQWERASLSLSPCLFHFFKEMLLSGLWFPV